ncbi:lipopolysaccharide-induced tumor necrosis factor-alpha factor homolog [Agrilus planipennis]|uniref:Lipopolysaccharide-induced tumor necrosis factor-alpha factor homolog n=1 Tax=Agrilus planipennis TaxID=224129 RepID=A0A1W4XVI2_AGRPL|nr:lipopolysaccharide-induced tumor necrosis factor-alpha factor homolog [Agrilus planipennis]XP_018336798.1 lipopolysaccharide-induced tumor necrosis factor-alpha factor homolog [Agrilus planipennis]XP_018336800.1 lipopolysaccharide-induced tumor necrosis factor-alpha factor homolog [Agrilus planipennis]XP_018336801.1 lipopolysaccharide-induced tumor necrosis factor-alpha factor homolog [Agrilus planipennis]
MVKDAPPPYTATAGGPPPPGFVSPPGYVPPPPTHATTVIVTAPPPGPFGPGSKVMVCPYCHSQISTKVVTEATTKTHLFALLLCLFVCWPCVCLPYCMDSCQNQNHYCPNCNAFLGAYDN